jgi:hypothetical protein
MKGGSDFLKNVKKRNENPGDKEAAERVENQVSQKISGGTKKPPVAAAAATAVATTTTSVSQVVNTPLDSDILKKAGVEGLSMFKFQKRCRDAGIGIKDLVAELTELGVPVKDFVDESEKPEVAFADLLKSIGIGQSATKQNGTAAATSAAAAAAVVVASAAAAATATEEQIDLGDDEETDDGDDDEEEEEEIQVVATGNGRVAAKTDDGDSDNDNAEDEDNFKKIVEASKNKKPVTLKTEEIAAYAKHSRTLFTHVLAALMSEFLKKTASQENQEFFGEQIRKQKEPEKCIIQQPGFKTRRKRAIRIYVRAACEELGIPIPPIKAKFLKGNICPDDEQLGYVDKKERDKVLAAFADFSGAESVPFYLHPIPVESLTTKDVTTMTQKEKDRLVAKCQAERKAAFDANLKGLEREKLFDADVPNNEFRIARYLIRRMLTPVPTLNALMFLPLVASSATEVDQPLLSSVRFMQFYYVPADSEDSRTVLHTPKSEVEIFFSKQLMAALVQNKVPISKTIDGRPAVDLMAFGDFLADRILGSSKGDARHAIGLELDNLQYLLVGNADQTPEGIEKNAAAIQVAVNKVLGFLPPIDWCRWRLNPDKTDAPKIAQSRRFGAKRRAGDVEDEEGDDDDDAVATTTATTAASQPKQEEDAESQPPAAKKKRTQKKKAVSQPEAAVAAVAPVAATAAAEMDDEETERIIGEMAEAQVANVH